jgi:hypothetical protein
VVESYIHEMPSGQWCGSGKKEKGVRRNASDLGSVDTGACLLCAYSAKRYCDYKHALVAEYESFSDDEQYALNCM